MKLVSCSTPVHHKIDASQYLYGRLCCHIAQIISNKLSIYSQGNKVLQYIEISNLYKVRFSSKDKASKHIMFYRHTRYPGHLKTHSLQYYINRNMLETYFKNSIARMLGKNQLYKKALKQNITFV